MNENNYYNILKIIITQDNEYELVFKNIYNKNIKILLDNNTYLIYPEQTQTIKFTEKNFNFNLKVEDDNFDSLFEEKINIPELGGFGEDSIIETTNGTLKISDIISGTKILNNRGKEAQVINVFVFKINNNESNFPIMISKSNCGINLPFQDLVLSVKNIVKIKKINLKGRNLILNKKAKIFNFKDSLDYYCLELENKNSYFVNGFIVNSV